MMAPQGPFGGMNAPSAMMQGGNTMGGGFNQQNPLQWEVVCIMTVSLKTVIASAIGTTYRKPNFSVELTPL